MKISKRLRVIGDLVKDNSFILDIGCDHALLDIYVVKNKKNIKAIASDINEKPLKIARENIKKYDAKNIKITKKDGLESYEEGVDTIILSGLGSKTIVSILKKDKDILTKIDKLIISSNNDYLFLRKSICDLGFKIEEEQIIIDKNKYYPIIVFTKGKEKYNSFELKYGPVLLKNKDKVFKDYLKLNKKKLLKIYNSLSNKYFFKKYKIKKEIKLIDKA